ncbi:MAG: hypothetical protein RIB03_12545 [Henriciella sp.]|uniref:hypothetical protein n=1 Tax=Henriciella sp. TaxID=1968823 RepID=UPI0032F005EE
MEVVTLKVAHRGEQCRYRIQIEPDAGASAPLLTSPSGSLEYGIQDGGPNVTADSRVEKFGMFSDMQREASHQFEIRVAPGQDVRAGRYTGHIRVSLFKDDNGLDTFQDERIVEVVADVAPTVSASFGTDPLAGSRSADIDFGVLSRNQSRSLQFSVAANTGYSLSLSSRERGRLKHEFTDFGIPYDLVLDGREIDLETAEHDQHLTGLQSSQHDLRFDVSSDPQTALAGFYSDQLTIVIAAQ